MGNFTVIADAGETIIALLRRELIPELLKRTEEIGLCSPDDKDACLLGLHLYNIEENPETKNQEKIMLDKEHFKNPPTSLNLYYMLFAGTGTELTAKAAEEQKVLGRAIQVLGDYSRIGVGEDASLLYGTLKENRELLDIHGLTLSYEEKYKVYSLFENKAFLAFFYKAGPVFIEAEKVRRLKRVSESAFTVHRKERGHMY